MPEPCTSPGSPSPSGVVLSCASLVVCVAGPGVETRGPASSRDVVATSRASTPAVTDGD